MARRQSWFGPDEEKTAKAVAIKRGYVLWAILKQKPPRTGKMTVIGFHVGNDIPQYLLKGKVDMVQKYPKKH